MSERQIILDGLKPLFEKARREKLLFHSYLGDIFAPDELERLQAEDLFVWEAKNWELVKPEQMIAKFKEAVEKAQREYQFFLDRLKAAGY
jgi:hypothetical protein